MRLLVRQVPFHHPEAGPQAQVVTRCPIHQNLCTWMTRPVSAWLAASPQALLAAGAIARRTARAFAVGEATTHRAEW